MTQQSPGRYRPVRPLGSRGRGAVWLCQDRETDRLVAVKQIMLLPGEHKHDVARGLREALLASSLEHDAVIRVLDIIDSGPAVVMEYVEGPSLAERLHRGSLHPSRAAGLGGHLAAGLAVAHGVGLLHRDIKPSNILLTPAGRAKIGDFGIARSAEDVTVTRDGFASGTVRYFSPELARGAPASPASDVWALGATLYQAVEGCLPHPQSRNPIAQLMTIARQPARPPERAGGLTPVLEAMLSADPTLRPGMAEVAIMLRAARDGAAMAAWPVRHAEPEVAGDGSGGDCDPMSGTDTRVAADAVDRAGDSAQELPADAGEAPVTSADGLVTREGERGPGVIEREASGSEPRRPGVVEREVGVVEWEASGPEPRRPRRFLWRPSRRSRG